MDSLEENDVHILDNRHWIFDRHADPRLHLPISEFPEILGLSWHRSGFVSDDYLIIVSFDVRVFPLYFSVYLPFSFQANGHWVGVLRDQRPVRETVDANIFRYHHSTSDSLFPQGFPRSHQY